MKPPQSRILEHKLASARKTTDKMFKMFAFVSFGALQCSQDRPDQGRIFIWCKKWVIPLREPNKAVGFAAVAEESRTVDLPSTRSNLPVNQEEEEQSADEAD